MFDVCGGVIDLHSPQKWFQQRWIKTYTNIQKYTLLYEETCCDREWIAQDTVSQQEVPLQDEGDDMWHVWTVEGGLCDTALYAFEPGWHKATSSLGAARWPTGRWSWVWSDKSESECHLELSRFDAVPWRSMCNQLNDFTKCRQIPFLTIYIHTRFRWILVFLT